jgi:uncharacterized phosphatase
MARFYLLRHGETEWNRDGNRYCGRTDIALSDTGREQVQSAKNALQDVPFQAAYASPLQRSRSTAERIAVPHGLAVKEDPRILEIDFGRWEGLSKKEIIERDPQGWTDWLQDPTHVRAGGNGESGLEVFQRALDFFAEKSQLHAGQNVLVVGHNTLNRLFICGSLDVPFSQYRRFIQSNTGISILELDGSEISWIKMNETAHLRRMGSQTV